jgi:hypothetical protein
VRENRETEGGSPVKSDRVAERLDQTPLRETVEALFNPATARIRHPDYCIEQALAAVE